MKRPFLIIMMGLALFSSADTVRAEVEEDVIVLDRVRKMRMRVQDEEGAIRIQKFIHSEGTNHCSPVQQVRERLKTTTSGGENGFSNENVNINAGHGELNVTDNHGTINSDVNVQIVNEGGSNIPCP